MLVREISIKNFIALLIVAVGLLAVSTDAFIFSVLPHIDNKNIRANGIPVTAEIIDYGSSFSINGRRPHLYLKFSFLSKEGRQVEVSTDGTYSYHDLENMGVIDAYSTTIPGRHMKISYIGNKAVVLDYNRDFSNSEVDRITGWSFFIISGIIGLWALIEAIIIIHFIKHPGKRRFG